MLYPAEHRDPTKYSIILRGKYTNVLFRIKLIVSNIQRIQKVYRW